MTALMIVLIRTMGVTRRVIHAHHDGQNLKKLLRCDAGHTRLASAQGRTVPAKQGATCDRDRPAGE